MIARALATCALGALLAGAAADAAAEDGEERCRRGLEAAGGGEHALAHALLADCPGEEAERARRAARETLEGGDFAPVSIAVSPESARVEVSALPGASFRGSVVLWLPFGEHEIRVEAEGRAGHSETVAVEDPSRISVVIELEEEAEGPGETTVDFGEEGGAAAGDPISTSDPGPKDHETLLPERFRRGGNDGPGEEADGGVPPLPFYVGGGVSLVAGALLHVAGEGDRARYAAYGLYGVGAVGLGLGAFFHLRAERRGASFAIAPGPRALLAIVRWH